MFIIFYLFGQHFRINVNKMLTKMMIVDHEWSDGMKIRTIIKIMNTNMLRIALQNFRLFWSARCPSSESLVWFPPDWSILTTEDWRVDLASHFLFKHLPSFFTGIPFYTISFSWNSVLIPSTKCNLPKKRLTLLYCQVNFLLI